MTRSVLSIDNCRIGPAGGVMPAIGLRSSAVAIGPAAAIGPTVENRPAAVIGAVVRGPATHG
ncbi:hypothetical protein [Salinispora fenicalii]|uniref:hypothetical protein n=1 Tax=Salinispora fenicalii TaxID=1137263 RepID=UPI0012BB9C55|nr:hypothetical protein [Salinispora fenicalii]